MTPAGNTVLIVYSLAVVSLLAIKSLRRLQKEVDKGLEAVMLVPVLILLINSI